MAGDVDRRATNIGGECGDLLDARATNEAGEADRRASNAPGDNGRTTNTASAVSASDLEVLPDRPAAAAGDGRAPTIEDLRERVAVLEALVAEIVTRAHAYWVEALREAAETLATPELTPPPGGTSPRERTR